MGGASRGRPAVAAGSFARAAALTLALVGIGPTRASGQIFDLTGTWTGSVTCQISNAGTKERSKLAPTVAVTQVGNAIGVRMDFGGGGVEQYAGLANPDGKKPLTKGELGLIHCGTDSVAADGAPSDEIGRFTAAVKAVPAIKASVKGKSVFAAPPRVGTCTWKWTRTAVEDPGVPTACPDV